MFFAKPPSPLDDPSGTTGSADAGGRPVSRPARRATRRLTLAVALCGLALAAACSSKPATPPPGAITDDRAVGDILVRFTPPAVDTSLQAGELLAQAKGPIRFVVKRPMSGGTWLVTAISPSPEATIEQAVTTLRALPRIEAAEADRRLTPSRPKPTGRDMPAN